MLQQPSVQYLPGSVGQLRQRIAQLATTIIAIVSFGSAILVAVPAPAATAATQTWAPWNPSLHWYDEHDYAQCGYGCPDRREYGVDVPLRAGTPIYAPQPGTITAYQPSRNEWQPGRLLLRLDAGEYVSGAIGFGHVRDVVPPGNHVNGGQEIATVGNNGSNSHVEFMHSPNGAANYNRADWTSYQINDSRSSKSVLARYMTHIGPPPPPVLPAVVGGQGTDSGLWVHQAGSGGFHPLAGVLNGPPAIVSVGGVRYYIVSGDDHRVYLRTDDMGWGVLSGPSIYCDYVSAAVSGSTLIVACKGSDGHLYRGTTGISAGQRPAMIPYFYSLGGEVTNGTAVAVVNGQPTYVVNGATAPNGRNVWTRTDSTGFTLMDYFCNGGPALAAHGSVAYFVCAGLGDAVYWAQNTGSGWSGGHLLGGAGRGTAALSIAPDNTATVFVEGSDNAVHFNTIPSGDAGSWQHLGGWVTGGVGAG